VALGSRGPWFSWPLVLVEGLRARTASGCTAAGMVFGNNH
jgi:hypothetical protein